MNDLIKVGELNTQDKITSLELVKQVNMFREQEGNRAELRHDTLRDIIKDEFSDEILSQKIVEKPVSSNGGRPSMVFELTLPQAKQVLVRESKFVRKAVIAYIEKLENALSQTFKVPTTLKEALLLAAEQLDVIEKQQTLLLEQAPKVEFYDDVVDSKDAIDMAQVAKVLNMGIGRNKLFQLLRDNNILDRKNQPYQNYVQAGYFRCVESSYMKPNGDTCVNIKTVVFQKGLNYISRLIKKSKTND